jgi:hypothetical protein
MAEKIDCKCGIPNCDGHYVKDGKALVNGHPLATQVTPSPELMKLYAGMLLDGVKEASKE